MDPQSAESSDTGRERESPPKDPSGDRGTPGAIPDELLRQLEDIIRHARRLEQQFAESLGKVREEFLRSGRNLLHYLALRNVDRRPLQRQLSALGLSSLGRAEAHVLASLCAVVDRLSPSASSSREEGRSPVLGFDEGDEALQRNSDALFGPVGRGRDAHIMVTLSTEAAYDYAFVRDLMLAGMDCARINCAHDSEEEWASMIEHIHRAEAETGNRCRVLIDLGGPKLRTAPLEPGPSVVKWRPKRSARGEVKGPARVLLVAAGFSPPEEVEADARLTVGRGWLDQVRPGDEIRFEDTRAKARALTVSHRYEHSCLAEGAKTSYVENGTWLELRRKRGGAAATVDSTKIQGLPPVEEPIVLNVGDTLMLRGPDVRGCPAVRSPDGQVLEPAVIGCTLPEVFSDVAAGQPVKLNDGKISGVVRAASKEALEVEITHARPRGSKLRGDKSINLPDTDLHMPSLTQKDRIDLDFVARKADMVGLSFVRETSDVADLQHELERRGGSDLGIVLKIETKRAFQQFPRLLLTAMRSYPVGVMIARGDLAVECGWERLAEVQEELLWLCEAAHVPVVWGTQVLEHLAKSGLPTRAEITDAAMAQRAECVMLNKGPYIRETIRTLDNILRRMKEHQMKKTAMLRRLLVARLET